jgi:hypothetical protein
MKKKTTVNRQNTSCKTSARSVNTQHDAFQRASILPTRLYADRFRASTTGELPASRRMRSASLHRRPRRLRATRSTTARRTTLRRFHSSRIANVRRHCNATWSLRQQRARGEPTSFAGAASRRESAERTLEVHSALDNPVRRIVAVTIAAIPDSGTRMTIPDDNRRLRRARQPQTFRQS